VAEWPVADPILRVLVLNQENATAKSIARMRRGESGRRRPFRQDPASGERMAERTANFEKKAPRSCAAFFFSGVRR